MRPASGSPILGQEESCTGDPARRMGNEYVYQMLASANVETLDRYGMGERTIVTACPHCFNTIGNEYGQLGGRYRIVHHSQYLAELLAAGRLRTSGCRRLDRRRSPTTTRATSPATTAYRRRRATCSARCPGSSCARWRRAAATRSAAAPAAGGCGWRRRAGTRINAERTRQALETGADTVATACPFCMTMLKDGLADAGRGVGTEAPVDSADIAELLAGSLAPLRTSRAGQLAASCQ